MSSTNSADSVLSPPESIPKYIAEGLPKQSDETLEDIKAYIERLEQRRDAPIDEAELGTNETIVDDDPDGKGVIVEETVKCGDESCHCMSGGELHGPYKYRYYRADGKTVSEYADNDG